MSDHTTTTPRRFSRLPTYDTGAWRAALIYADALLGATEQAGQTEAVVAEFDSFIQDVMDRLPKLEAVFGSAFVDEDAKLAMLDKALRGRASNLFLNVLKVIARHGRLEMLRLIHLATHVQLDELRGRVRVLVSTAVELDSAAEDRIVHEIRNRLAHQEPILEKHVDPALVGGIVLRVGDRVFDGSLATQLARVREQLKHRSVYEIQSRRDRFRTPEGN